MALPPPPFAPLPRLADTTCVGSMPAGVVGRVRSDASAEEKESWGGDKQEQWETPKLTEDFWGFHC